MRGIVIVVVLVTCLIVGMRVSHSVQSLYQPNVAPLSKLMERHDKIMLDPNAFYMYWDYRDPSNVEWIHFMSALTASDGPQLLPLVRPLLVEPVLELGGNCGTFARLLAADVTVWDQTHVIKHSDYHPSVGGNFLHDPFPAGRFRTALFKSVLHDLSDGDVQLLFRRIMASTIQRLVIVEVMRPLDHERLAQPRFSHLRPFVRLFRAPSMYSQFSHKAGFHGPLEQRTCKPLLYTILMFQR